MDISTTRGMQNMGNNFNSFFSIVAVVFKCAGYISVMVAIMKNMDTETRYDIIPWGNFHWTMNLTM